MSRICRLHVQIMEDGSIGGRESMIMKGKTLRKGVTKDRHCSSLLQKFLNLCSNKNSF